MCPPHHDAPRARIDACPTNRQSAFTLLELMIVVGVLSALAFGAVSLVDESDSHVRFDSSKIRLSKLREGIIGDPSAFLNRPPIIQGYLADMGRLPNSIDELLNQGTQPPWNFDEAANLWAGWRGPYLQTFDQKNGQLRYSDGWGNYGDTNNFGWRFEIDQDLGTVLAQSYGADGQPGGSSFDLDYPNSGYLVNPHEALVNVANWKVLVYLTNPTTNPGGGGNGGNGELITICHKPGTSAEKTLTVPLSSLPAHLGHGDYIGTCSGGGSGGGSGGSALPSNSIVVRLRMYYPQEGVYTWPNTWPQTTEERDQADYLSKAVTIEQFLVPDGESIEVLFDFGGSHKTVPLGVRSLALVDDASGAFIGDVTQEAWTLPLLPKMQLPTFRMAWALE